MRILFLSSVYPRPYALVRGIYCHSLCRALAKQHEVQVISPVSWVERFRHGKLADTGTELAVTYPSFFYPPRILRRAHGWFMWQSIRRRVRKIVDQFEPDCVLSYWLHPDGEAAIRAAHLRGVPSAVIVGGSDALLLPKEPGRRGSILRVLEQADALITVSRGLKEKLVELGAEDSKTHVIYQGIDTARFCPGDQAEARRRLGIPLAGKKLLWVGGMVPVKGLDILLDAVTQVAKQEPDSHLYLLGDGPLRNELAAKVETLGLSRSVSFVGSVTHDRLPDWYRAADLTVLSSWSEGIPNVLRESLACGTPFVSTNVGDIAELSPESATELVPPGNPSAFAEAVRTALQKQRANLSLPRLDSWDNYAENVADLLRSLIQERCSQATPQSAELTAVN